MRRTCSKSDVGASPPFLIHLPDSEALLHNEWCDGILAAAAHQNVGFAIHKLTNHCCRWAVEVDPAFENLVRLACAELSVVKVALIHFLSSCLKPIGIAITQLNDAAAPQKDKSAEKVELRSLKYGPCLKLVQNRALRESRLIPNLTFAMEQFDRHVLLVCCGDRSPLMLV
jgi:hypothetical protein